MILEVSTAKMFHVEIFPATELEEIAQNVLTIITTVRGEVPLDRVFGIDASLLDNPINTVQAKLSAQIIEGVRKFEPRARVTEVIYGGNAPDGRLNITARIKVVKNGLN